MLLRQDIEVGRTELRRELAQQGADLRVELHRGMSGVARQMCLTAVGQMAVMLGFLTQLR